MLMTAVFLNVAIGNNSICLKRISNFSASLLNSLCNSVTFSNFSKLRPVGPLFQVQTERKRRMCQLLAHKFCIHFYKYPVQDRKHTIKTSKSSGKEDIYVLLKRNNLFKQDFLGVSGKEYAEMEKKMLIRCFLQ